MRRPWNQHDARLAVAAKERLRQKRAETIYPSDRKRAPRLRMPKADFIIRIETRRGERLQVSVNRFMGRVRTSDGQSARQFCRGMEQLFTKSA